MIPDDYHKLYSFNCLTPDQFKLLQSRHELDDLFDCTCDDCGEWLLGPYKRCCCDNRRCYLMYHQQADKFYCEVD